MIVHHSADFTGAGGIRLFRRSWLPSPSARAAVIVVHGYAEHSGRYEWFGEQLAGAGFGVHAYDLRGHGRSDGPRVRVKSFREHLDDLAIFLAAIRSETSAPLFLFGHSMGGLIAALYAAVRQPELAGLVLSGPAVTPPEARVRAAAKVAGLAAKVAPGIPTVRLSASAVSRDQAVVDAYRQDPLVYHGAIPAATLAAMVRASARVHRDAAEITMPLLIVHGGEDSLVPPAASQALFDRVGSHDRVLKQYDGLYHEVLNEPEKERVLGDIRAWLDGHL